MRRAFIAIVAVLVLLLGAMSVRHIQRWRVPAMALRSSHVAVVRDALTQLRALGPRAAPAIPDILRLLGSDTHPPVDYIGSGVNGSLGERAASALSAIGAPALPALTRATRDTNPIVRRNAVKGLRGIADPGKADGLLFASQDSNIRTREMAREILLDDQMQGRVHFAAAPFIAACSHSNACVRATALLTLGQIRDKQAAETVMSHLNDADATVREVALAVLAGGYDWIKDERALAPLLTAASNEDSNVRYGAARSLGPYRDARAVPQLAVLLRDADMGTRCLAAISLGQIGGKPALSNLLAALTVERDSWVRDNILIAIGEVRDVEALPTLLAILKGDSNRWYAAGAFEKIAGRPFSEDPDWKRWTERRDLPHK